MALELTVRDPTAQAALAAAAKAVSLELPSTAVVYRSPWRAAALVEAVERDPRSEPTEAAYALSPRSTRGATRA